MVSSAHKAIRAHLSWVTLQCWGVTRVAIGVCLNTADHRRSLPGHRRWPQITTDHRTLTPTLTPNHNHNPNLNRSSAVFRQTVAIVAFRFCSLYLTSKARRFYVVLHFLVLHFQRPPPRQALNSYLNNILYHVILLHYTNSVSWSLFVAVSRYITVIVRSSTEEPETFVHIQHVNSHLV